MCRKLLWVMSLSLLFVAGIVNASSSDSIIIKKISSEQISDNDSQYVPWEMELNNSNNTKVNMKESRHNNYHKTHSQPKHSSSAKLQ